MKTTRTHKTIRSLCYANFVLFLSCINFSITLFSLLLNSFSHIETLSFNVFLQYLLSFWWFFFLLIHSSLFPREIQVPSNVDYLFSSNKRIEGPGGVRTPHLTSNLRIKGQTCKPLHCPILLIYLATPREATVVAPS